MPPFPMPRKARIYALGALQHIIIKRDREKPFFLDSEDDEFHVLFLTFNS
jgi:hypothetical protein